jgi:hypothetical protein
VRRDLAFGVALERARTGTPNVDCDTASGFLRSMPRQGAGHDASDRAFGTEKAGVEASVQLRLSASSAT